MSVIFFVLSLMTYCGYYTQLTAKSREADYCMSAIAAHHTIARHYCASSPIVPIAQQSPLIEPDAQAIEKSLGDCPVKKQESAIKNTVAVEEEIPAYDDPNLLPYLIAIVGNFGKVLLDPTNTPNVIVCIGQIIDNIIYVAREVTRAPLSIREKDRLISAMHKEIKRVIVAYKYVQHRPIYKN